MLPTYSIQQVAERANVSKYLVQKWLDENLLPYIQVPGSKMRRVTHEALVQFSIEHNYPLLSTECIKQKVGLHVEIDGDEFVITDHVGDTLTLERDNKCQTPTTT